MNKFNVFVVLSIVAAASLFGAMVTPALAQDNMSMTMDNSSMPMDQMGNMTMTMDNSTGMGNGTMTGNYKKILTNNIFSEIEFLVFYFFFEIYEK